MNNDDLFTIEKHLFGASAGAGDRIPGAIIESLAPDLVPIV